MAFMRGEHAVVVLFIDGKKVDELDVESWSVDPVVDDISDGINGEDRDRLDKAIRFYRISLGCLNASAQKLKTLLAYDDALENDQQPSVQFGLSLRSRKGGAKDLFTATEAIIGGWKWASGGRTARQKLDIPVNARYFKPAA
jgi:hypothetical protein